MKQTQPQRVQRLLSRKSGCTAMEICQVAGTVSPHKRMSELRALGWKIRREPVRGQRYGRYYGTQPA